MNQPSDKYVIEQITKLGFKPEELSAEKKYILLEPIDAPENYHCDGEVNKDQAKARWKGKMQDAGFTLPQTNRVARHYGI